MVTAESDSARKDPEPARPRPAAASPAATLDGAPSGALAAGWLGHEVLTHPANAGVRRLATRSAQQAHGNRFVQRMLSTPGDRTSPGRPIQRQATGTSEEAVALPDAPDPVAARIPPDGAGEPLDGAARRFMEPRFGRDLGDVRIHADESAAAAATALEARAFTTGRDVYFARGEYAPQSADGRRLLAHELVHTVQQGPVARMPATGVSSPDDPLEREAERLSGAIVDGAPLPEITPGDPVLARDVATLPFSTSSGTEGLATGIKAKAWVAKHAANLIGKVGYELSLANLEITAPFVTWREGQRRQFLIDVWQPFWAGQGNAWSMLQAAMEPDRLDRAVDSGRDTMTGDLGPEEWREAVVGEVYKVASKRLMESLARIVPRWLAVKNQLAFLAAAGETGADRDPSRDEVFASHPMDVHVLGALPGKLDLDLVGYRKAHPEAAQSRAIRSELRLVTFDFQMKSGAWNWIRVTSPADATPEEVAKALYGTETKAYLLTAAPPLFGFDDIDDLAKEPQKRYNQEGVKVATDPSPVPSIIDPTPGQQILAGPLADQAALLQSRRIKGNPGATKGTVIDRMRVIVRTLDQIAKDAAPVGGIAYSVEPESIVPVRDRVDRRSAALAGQSDAEAVQWDAQSRGQLELVNAADSGLVMARQQQEAFKGWPPTRKVIGSIAHAYARVAQNSELVETGRWWLNFADEQSRLFPVTLMDLLLVDLRRGLRSAHEEKTGVVSQRFHEDAYDITDMESQEKTLRAELVKVRDVVLQHPDQAKAALDPLFKKIEDLQFRVALVTDLDECDRVWKALYDSLSVAGEIRSIWGGGNDIVRDAMHDAGRLNSEWQAIYREYLFGDKDKARAQLQEKAKSPEWAGFMDRIRQVIKDQATYDKWTTFAVMVGIAILTAGIGTYVEAAAGAAWGAAAGFAASTVVEAATFTSLSYALVTKDPSISGFFHEFGKNILTFGALKLVSRVYRIGVGAEAAASAGGKAGEVLVQFVAMNGAALYEADQEKREKTGLGLTMSEIGEISLNNLAFLVAVSIGGKLTEPWVTELRIQGELHGDFVRLQSERTSLVKLSETVQAQHSKDPATARKMLAKQAELLALEEKALTRLEQLATDPKAAAAAGLSPEQQAKLAGSKAEVADALDKLQQAKIATQLETAGPNEFLVEGDKKFEEVKDFYEHQKGTEVSEPARDPVTNARILEVRPADMEPFHVAERTPGKDAVGLPAEAAVAEGEPAEALADVNPPDPKSVPDTPPEPAEPKGSAEAKDSKDAGDVPETADQAAEPPKPEEKAEPSEAELKKQAKDAAKKARKAAREAEKLRRSELRKLRKQLASKKSSAERRAGRARKKSEALRQRAAELRKQATLAKGKDAERLNRAANQADRAAKVAGEEANAAFKEAVDALVEIKKVDYHLTTDAGTKIPCFAAGTPVWTANGPIPIETLQVGDMVLARDFEGGSTVQRRVLDVLENRTMQFHRIAVSTGPVLATGLHRFWVASEGEWIEARSLRKGMELLMPGGESATIVEVDIEHAPHAPTFNLHIEESATYFVGPGLLVHNAGAPSYSFGNLRIYVGTNSKFPDFVYVGQTDDLDRRQEEHREEALKKLQDKTLTQPEREFWEFKSEIVLEEKVSGLDADMANFMEQTNIDLAVKSLGYDNVMNRRDQVARKNMSELEARIKANPKVKAAGYC